MTGPKPPLAVLAELTHRCPLSCPYCSNPLELERRGQALDDGADTGLAVAAFEDFDRDLVGHQHPFRRQHDPAVAALVEAHFDVPRQARQRALLDDRARGGHEPVPGSKAPGGIWPGST